MEQERCEKCGCICHSEMTCICDNNCAICNCKVCTKKDIIVKVEGVGIEVNE